MLRLGVDEGSCAGDWRAVKRKGAQACIQSSSSPRMREELTRLGVKELRTAQDVDDAVGGQSGTLMLVVNSVCGCAAGKARPGVALALQHGTTPTSWPRSLPAPTSRRPARARLLHGLSALLARRRPAAGRQARLHDGAAPDREPGSGRHRPGSHRRVRQALRAGRRRVGRALQPTGAGGEPVSARAAQARVVRGARREPSATVARRAPASRRIA